MELSVDGYENLTTDNITDEMFDKANYSVTELSGNQKIDAGQPVYRLVTDEEWTVTKEYLLFSDSLYPDMQYPIPYPR